MEIVPFIYFSLLTICLYKRSNEVTIAVYMSALYAFSAFCGVLMMRYKMFDTSGLSDYMGTLELNIVPTFLYCSLITIVILPFVRINKNYIKSIYITNKTYYNYFLAFLFLLLVLNIYKTGDGIGEIMSGDLKAMRDAHYAEEEVLETERKLAFPFNYINVFYMCSILALPCFFYSICFQKKSLIYNCLILLISLSAPIAGLAAVDRSEMIFFILLFIFCYLFFRPFIKDPQKRILRLIATPIGVVMMIYLYSVTVSRFGERDSGAGGGFIQYAGQSYLNFCHFYEHRNPHVFNTVRALPLCNKIINAKEYDNDARIENNKLHGFFTGIFASFLGSFLLDMGVFPMIMWAMFYAIICNYILSREPGGRKSLGLVLLILILGIVPTFGVIAYRYVSIYSSLLILVSIMSYIFLKYKIRI